MPDRLITELMAHRTLALRDALAETPAITFQAVLHSFVLATFYRFASSGSCLTIGLHPPTFPAQAVREAKGERSAQLIDHLKKADMAKEAERLLDRSGLVAGAAASRRPRGIAGGAGG